MRSMARRIGCLVIGVGMSACGGAQPAAGGGQCTTGVAGALEVCPGTNGRIANASGETVGYFAADPGAGGTETWVFFGAGTVPPTSTHPFLGAPMYAVHLPKTRIVSGANPTFGALIPTSTAITPQLDLIQTQLNAAPKVIGYAVSNPNANGSFTLKYYVPAANLTDDCLSFAPGQGRGLRTHEGAAIVTIENYRTAGTTMSVTVTP